MDTTEMTDRLKGEVAARMAALTPYLTTDQAMTTEEATRLLGVVLDGIDVAMATDDLEPGPWPVGAPVRMASGYDAHLAPGHVVRAVETDGEVHTVLVKWPNVPGGAMTHSPRELERVQ